MFVVVFNMNRWKAFPPWYFVQSKGNLSPWFRVPGSTVKSHISKILGSFETPIGGIIG